MIEFPRSNEPNDYPPPLHIIDPHRLNRGEPVVTILNSILFKAVKDNASSIEATRWGAEGLIVAFDGQEIADRKVPIRYADLLVNRSKIIAKLDTASQLEPQVGKFELRIINESPRLVSLVVRPTAIGEELSFNIQLPEW